VKAFFARLRFNPVMMIHEYNQFTRKQNYIFLRPQVMVFVFAKPLAVIVAGQSLQKASCRFFNDCYRHKAAGKMFLLAILSNPEVPLLLYYSS
jgi:hypothetical protein